MNYSAAIVSNARPVNYRKFPVVSATSTKSHYRPRSFDYIDFFYSNLRKWESETSVISSVAEIQKHRSFVSIVNLGELAIPLILDELRVEPSLLFLALRRITSEDTVSPSDRGYVKSMVDAWLAWGARNGF
jgi:hypothetical protein